MRGRLSGWLLYCDLPDPESPDSEPDADRVLLLGGALFLLGVAFLFLWMDGGPRVFLGVGVGAVSVSALSLAVAARWMRRGPDPLQARREQRLWRSGPLGRWWLEKRKRLP